ncbi:MAG: phenylalanine--tRNA ligase beta subunit-related protein, partial [Candidatus Magasanikbacteria bacterium]|nr:phenylalanine--tRNA ligase beta subunit-related protein [Candidatus Magasanikbacteria bacterium]
IDETTKEVFLMAPIYEPTAIRKASLFTGLRTEASNRFEKKLDPNMHPKALNRAIKLLVENANANFASTITNTGYPVPQTNLNFDIKLVKQILGIDLNQSDVINILSPLGFMVSAQPLNEGSMLIKIPSHRPDISLPEDILEEIGRIYGYNNFPKTLPQGEMPIQKEQFEPDKEQIAREYLLNCGFTETTGYSLVSEADLKKISFQPNDALAVLHPTSSDFVFLRPSLLINLLKAVSVNQTRTQISFFEIAKEFGKEIFPKTKLPKQGLAWAFISNQNYGTVKSIVETLLNKFNLKPKQSSTSETQIFSFGTNYKIESKTIAKIGLINKELLGNFEIERNLVYAWIDFEYLSQEQLKINYKPLPKFPSVIEDISFFNPKSDSAGEIVKFIENYNKLITKAEIIDAFEKEGKLSLTLRLNFRSETKTLTSKEVSKMRKQLEKALTKTFKIVIRRE